MSHTSELRDRIEARKKALEAQLLEWKADAKGAWQEQIDNVEKELSSLKELVKDGWDNVSESVAKKLNEWLSKDKNR